MWQWRRDYSPLGIPPNFDNPSPKAESESCNVCKNSTGAFIFYIYIYFSWWTCVGAKVWLLRLVKKSAPFFFYRTSSRVCFSGSHDAEVVFREKWCKVRLFSFISCSIRGGQYFSWSSPSSYIRVVGMNTGQLTCFAQHVHQLFRASHGICLKVSTIMCYV